MNVWEHIRASLEKGLKLHMTLIDPDKQSPEMAGEMSKAVGAAGSDAIMVGGSTALCQDDLDETVRTIKDNCELPVILFPTTASCLSNHADAIFFMSMLNSKSLNFIIGEHKKGAPIIKQMDIEPIPMAYIVVEPGMKAGEVGEAELLKRDAYEDAKAYALVAEYFGMKLVYFEAGSGAPEHVPMDMIHQVAEYVNIPIIVGGGIRTKEAAANLAEAGANIVVTGTIVEETENIQPTLSDIVSAAKGQSKSDLND